MKLVIIAGNFWNNELSNPVYISRTSTALAVFSAAL